MVMLCNFSEQKYIDATITFFCENYTYVILFRFSIFFNYLLHLNYRFVLTNFKFHKFRFFSFFVILLCIDATDATELLPTVREKLFFIWKLFVHTRKQHDWLLCCRNNTANVTILYMWHQKLLFERQRISVWIKWKQSNTHSFMRKMNSFSKQELCVWSYCSF